MSVAALFAIDPAGLGGVLLQGGPSRARDRWLAELCEALPPGSPVRRMPLHITPDRLFGGIDLAGTLQAGKRLAQAGILAQADGGLLVLASAERVGPATAAGIAAAMDRQEVFTERDGLTLRHAARIGVVALNEGDADEAVASSLQDRLAFWVDAEAESPDVPDVAAARARLPDVTASDEVIESLCVTAAALGISSLRAPLLAVRAARVAAAIAGRDRVGAEDAALAARLVLAPRATVLPAPPEETTSEAPPPDTEDEAEPPTTGPLADVVLAAALAALPPGLLAKLKGAPGRAKPGKAGAPGKTGARGRPAGTREGDPRHGARLHLMETLRAAAPWQTIRGRDGRMQLRRGDFRIARLKPRTESTTIFLVDASGSQAINRLAEAKGAVELLLADCYARRDQVALLAFRGRAADLLLPPTRSLVRAKRCLASLPGGGGTPLAAGLDAAFALANQVRRRGSTPTIVLLTDGQANVGRDGRGGRPAAERDAAEAASRIRDAGHSALLLDSSARPHPSGRLLASTMGARYLALPFATAATLSGQVRTAMA